MRSLPLSNLNRRPGEIVDMALSAPIVLTKHGRQSVVIMSAEAYDSLVSRNAGTMDEAAPVNEIKKPASSFLVRQAAKAFTPEEE
ncbi:MAG: type II toxin-antitoxin system prevent-host-death family antitoxin [Devosia sp.]